MNTRRLHLAGLGAVALFGLADALRNPPDWQVTSRTPARRDRDGVPNVALVTHTGAKVRFVDDLVRDRLVAIHMMYTACSRTCPEAMRNLLEVQRLLGPRLGRDVFLYSITLRPAEDSPAALARYAQQHEVQPGWQFLTGAPADIERLRIALGFYDADARVDRQEGRHVGMVRIGNGMLRRWGSVPALATPKQIVSAIRRMDMRPAGLG